MALSRAELFALAKAGGWVRGATLTTAQRTRIVAAIGAAVAGPALEQARVHDSQGSRPMSASEAVDALLEELNA